MRTLTHHHNHNSGKFFFALSVLVVPFANAVGAELFEELPNRSNCGLVAAIAVADLLKKPFDATTLERQLPTGADNGRPLNLLEIQNALSAREIEGKVVFFTDVSEFVRALAPEKPAIVQTNGSQTEHFVTIGVRQGSYFLYDYPKYTKLSAEKLSEVLKSNGATGYALVTGLNQKSLSKQDASSSQPVALAKEKPATQGAPPEEPVTFTSGKYIKIPEKIDALVPPVGVGILSVRLPVTNTGDQPLSLTKVAGSCSCFLGAEDPKLLIPPGSTQDLVLRFAADRVTKPNYLVNVAVSSSDPLVPTTLTAIQFTKKPDAGSLTVLHSTCFLGAHRSFAGQEAQFYLVDARPSADLEKLVKGFSYDKSKLEFKGKQPSETQFDGTKIKSLELVFSIQQGVSGYFSEPVVVYTNDPDYPEIKLQVSGVALSP